MPLITDDPSAESTLLPSCCDFTPAVLGGLASRDSPRFDHVLQAWSCDGRKPKRDLACLCFASAAMADPSCQWSFDLHDKPWSRHPECGQASRVEMKRPRSWIYTNSSKLKQQLDCWYNPFTTATYNKCGAGLESRRVRASLETCALAIATITRAQFELPRLPRCVTIWPLAGSTRLLKSCTTSPLG